jgi:hypothetical protein
MEQPAGERVAHHQPGAARMVQAIGAVAKQEAGGVAQGRDGARRSQQMADVGAIDHQAPQ